MACLYCGKEIGPIRLIRDSEFCSPKHRKEYKERLRKVLIQVGEPETAAHGMAPFADALRPLAGSRAPKAAPLDFSASEHLFHSRISWNIAIPPVLGQEFAPIRRAGAEIPPRSTRRDFRTEPYEYFGEQAAEKLTLPAVKLAAALPQPGAPAALASPETASTAALPVPHGSWIARTTLLRIPDRLPGVKGISSAADHPLCGPLGLDYRVARITPRAATLASPLSAPAVSEPVLPTLFPAVAECAEMADEATPLVPTGACANFQPGPAPEAAAREVHSHLAATGPAFFEQRLPIIPTAALCARPEPALIALPVPSAEPAEIAARSRDLLKPATGKLESVVPASSPEIPSAQMAPGAERWTAVPHVEPVERSVSARCASPAPFAAPPLQIQPLAVALAQDRQAARLGAAEAGHRQLAPAVSAPAAPAAMSKPVPVAPEQPLRFPKLVASSAAGRLLDSKKPFELHSPQAAVPEFRTPNRNAVIIEPIAAIPLTAPEPAAEAPPAGISDCGLRPIAYYCHRGEPTPRCECASMAPSFRPTLPRLAVRPIFDRQEEFTSQRTIEKKPTFAEILSLPEAVALRKRSALVRHGAAAIAASLAVAFGLWVGIGATRLRTQALNRDASEIAAAIKPSGSATPTGPAAHGVSGALAWVKTAAAKRAAVELNDGFQQGMQAWSGAGKGWAPGWSRNPDGYVRLGQLALFRPSLNYSDYRMEFLGQIESKGMGWVVRAHDSQNYYAMKFNVVQPGLRPILSMVHYPVVAGKKGHKIETPLSVMIHNDTPYHVLVEVHGNRFTTSIEGQEVDSWTDEALAAGGVGFFSDAGEHARLYWMKLYKNDDWLGRICAYLAGGSDAPKDTAWLERPGLPTPAPERREVPCPQAAILAGETGDLVFSDSQRPGVSTGRNNKWKS